MKAMKIENVKKRIEHVIATIAKKSASFEAILGIVSLVQPQFSERTKRTW
jgi:hypothetical protein